eukprot:4437374-Heterocapsa_arctica.AAC.1
MSSERQIWAPEQLQGRVGAVRFSKKGLFDVSLMTLYLPPKTNEKLSRVDYQQVLTWASNILSILPARTTPILLMDANAHVGAGTGQTRCTGPFGAGNDNLAGARLRFFMDANFLALTNTWRRSVAGPTFAGGR